MKYILISGGVISGVGKGLISSSVGLLLKAKGYTVTMIKIDPYINIDAGTFSPYEHGEVFVLDDGSEVDLDLGNYERFLDITLSKFNNITSGHVYQNVIAKERQGLFLGKTVQVIPHITDEIQDLIEKAAHFQSSDVCIIELGGTVGDIESMPFVEALRQMQFRLKRENFCNIHVSLVPYLRTSQESKTKPTQQSVRTLRKLGIQPQVIVCRSEIELNSDVINKVAMFCDVNPDHVISLIDQECVFMVPLALDRLRLGDILVEQLEMQPTVPNDCLLKWTEFTKRAINSTDTVSIAIVGKYSSYPDAYTSVIKALEHASILCRRKLKISLIDSAELDVPDSDAWKLLKSQIQGIVVPGGFGHRGIEGKIAAIKWARLNGISFLGICLGMQCAVIEFCRNVVGITNANSEEFQPDNTENVIIEMPEHNPFNAKGGTMRLGLKKTVLCSADSVVKKLYSNHSFIEERHRHRYEVNKQYVDEIERNGMHFVGTSEDGLRMEIVEIPDHPYFVGVQFHPEYLSRAVRPSPVYIGLIASACKINTSNLKFTYSCMQLNQVNTNNSVCQHCHFGNN
ncbi:hypothetical protein GJ496_004678 [Pomphorhynchus laevis]|nr:hypothetical protein GJ496_004678 [Pomphorhynchus laevis]